jgi:hypothetical protein
MLRFLRTVLALLAVAVFSCGNALSVMAEQGEHGQGAHTGAAPHLLVHAHGHDHEHDPAAHHTHDVNQSVDVCQGSTCAPDDNPENPCCHVHGHCCVSGGFVPSSPAYQTPELRRTELAISQYALPSGAIVNPLLRPPRATV